MSSVALRLFGLSFLTLYFELSFIRFTSAEVLYLGYFSNFVLISVFLGIGIGFLVVDKKIDLIKYLPQLILLLISFVLVTHIDASVLRQNMGQLFFGKDGFMPLMRLPLGVCLLFIFGGSTAIFACIAQETARAFKHFKPLTAYSIDILGSLLGVAAFTLHSYLERPAHEWFLVSAILVVLLSPRAYLINSILIGLGVFTVVFSVAPQNTTTITKWSPYQKIEVWPTYLENGELRTIELSANGIGHQSMTYVGRKEPIYDFPYVQVQKIYPKKYEDILIIGAGSGTDITYALHYATQDIKSIDAVEIDPVIQDAGKRFHPLKPYSDPRVNAVVNDGRAFMEQTDKKYDLIIYALPDSLASLSNLGNIRLESFLFTEESFAQAKKLLKADGVVVMYNYYRTEWLVDKLSIMLNNVFGHYPFVIKGYVSALAIGPNVKGSAPAKMPEVTPATDSWPFIYMENPDLPPMYVLIMVLFVLSGIVAVWGTGHAKQLSVNGPFALMGSAFLLLETKSVIQFSLLFGATWMVNAMVFFAVLTSILIANLFIAKTDIKSPTLLFFLLIMSLLVQYFLPLNTLLEIEDISVRYIVTSIVLFSPIFFANLVFSSLFKDTKISTVAFGWNIIGTMIGGALEYTSMAIGYQALTLVILALYSACFIWFAKLTQVSK